MKKKIGIWMSVLAMGFGPMALADNEWGVFGSYWSPSDGEDSFGGGVKVGIEMVDRVQLDLRYSAMSNLLDDEDGDLDAQPLEFGLSFSIPNSSRIEPYVGVGLGYYLLSSDLPVDDEVGFYVSTGVEMILSRSGASYGETTTKLFVEAMYRSLDTDIADISGFGAQAGLLIGW